MQDTKQMKLVMYVRKKVKRINKHLLFDCKETAEMANRLGLSTAKDLFITSIPNQWASIEYATTIIINSWKESIQKLKVDLTRKMTEMLESTVRRTSKKDQSLLNASHRQKLSFIFCSFMK